MQFSELFSDKSLKPKEKTERLCSLLTEKKIKPGELVAFAQSAKDPVKASCIEALEYLAKKEPAAISEPAFDFCIRSLSEKAPRIKWEAARVIGNSIHLFPAKIKTAVPALLDNTEHEGTVVRWSAAYALSQIILLKTAINKTLVPAAEAIIRREEKNSIQKIYLAAIKKAAK